MSRIDEALRRAGAAHSEFEERRGTAILEPRVAVDPSTLERYASENDPPLSKTVAAPLESRRTLAVAASPTLVQHTRRIAVAPTQQGKLVISRDIAPYTA